MKRITKINCKYKIVMFAFSCLISFIIGTDCSDASDADPKGGPVNINVGHVISSFSDISSDEIRVALRVLFETRFKKQFPRYTAKVNLFSDIHSAVDAIKKRQIDGLGMMTLDYVMTKHENNILPVRTASLGNSASAKFVLLVSKEKYQSIEMLRNKKLVIEKGGHGDIAKIWIDTLLLKQSLPEGSEYFDSINRIEKSSRVILKVFFGKADACIVPQKAFDIMKELNPQVQTNLQVLFESPEFYLGIFGIVKDISERKKQFMLDFVDNLTGDQEGKQILLMFRVNQISEFNPEYLKSVETLYETYKELKSVDR